MAFSLRLSRVPTPWLVQTTRLSGTNPCPHVRRQNLSYTCSGYGRLNRVSLYNGRIADTRIFTKRIPQPVNHFLRCSSLHTETLHDVNKPQISTETANQLTGPAPSCLDDPTYVDKILEGLNFDFDVDTNYHLGLGSGLTPVGWVQNSFEMFNMGFGLPWFSAIAYTTMLVRFCFFPLVIRPGLILRQKMDALGCADVVDPLKADQLWVQNNISGPKIMALQIFHVTTWVTFYIAIKKMIAAPVPSWTTGGQAWFPDLTVADPLFILPTIATASSLLLFNMSSRWRDPEMKRMANIAVLSSIVPASICPTAFLSFWITSNVWSILQAGLLKFPQGRKFLGIPEIGDFKELDTTLLEAGEKVEESEVATGGKTVV